MENERKKSSIILKDGTKIEHYDYAEAGEIMDLNNLTETPERNRKLFEILVISVNGETEDIWNKVRALKYQTYLELDGILAGVLRGEKDEAVKKN